MANVFKATKVIVQEMCDDLKEITGVTLSPDMKDDSTVIKFWAYAGAVSSLYSEMQRSLNDFFPNSASVEGLRKHLAARLMPDQIQPQKSHGQIQFGGTVGTSIAIGQAQVKRKSDGAIFQNIQAGTVDSGGNLFLYFESLETGNSQNLDAVGEPFDLITPIAGINGSCMNSTKFLDGRDLETATEMLARIQAHDRDDDTGGNAVAYERWAHEASAEVVTAKCLRLVRGPDSVDVVITSGTSDIASAVENDEPVTRLPSAELVLIVQWYIETLNPVTDDVLVRGPTEQNFDTTIKYSLISESAANRAYVDSIITKVWKTFVYQARPQDTLTPTALEREIDKRVGDLIKEREVENFNGGITFYTVPDDKILTPNTLTLSGF